MCFSAPRPKSPPPMKPLPPAPAAPEPPKAPPAAPEPLQSKEAKTVFKAGDARSVDSSRKKTNASALRIPLNTGSSSGGLNI